MANDSDLSTAVAAPYRPHHPLTPVGDALLQPAEAIALLKYHGALAMGRESGDARGARANGPVDVSPADPTVNSSDRWDRVTGEPGAAPAVMLRLLAAGRTPR